MQANKASGGRALAGLLLAGALLLAGVAKAEEARGSAAIEAIGAADRTVVLKGNTYRVLDSTHLENDAGTRLTFEELPSLAAGASPEEAAVWFEAGEASGMGPPPLVRLLLTGSIPR